ncbi:MerR family DNA-binding transcriptional regulator [Tepidibacillus marianensis]|uniref:MerR family transcriptional regulator n=1 Tax=Tepidibacillus marianensis TaxID=3131995 RepID=UPI0030D5AFDF
MDQPELFSISDLANQFDISTRTIRYYEEIGLLQPKRDNNQYRQYTRTDRARLKLILRGKRFGFSLDEIKEMIELFDTDRTGRAQFQKTIQYGDKKIEEINQRIEELTELRDDLIELRNQFNEKLNKELKK